MSIHDLKIDPQPFADLVSGAKTCEVRNDDRGFEVGDTVRFPGGHCCTISHIQRGYGLPDGLCVLSYAQDSAAPEQQPVGYADPKSFDNFKNLSHLGGLYLHEWMWAKPAPGLVALYTHADDGEVGRLRAELKAWMNAEADKGIELVQLRRQLAEFKSLHSGEHGLPNDGWPEYHKRKMRTLRDLITGRYEHKMVAVDQKLAQAQALLAKVINSGALSDDQHEDLEADICAAVDVVSTLKKQGFADHLESEAEKATAMPDYKRECVKSPATAQPADGVKSDE